MLLHTTGQVEALVDPEMTGAKRLRAFFGKRQAEPSVLPGLDVQALRLRYAADGGYGPRMVEGTFKLPVGTRWEAYLRHRDRCVNSFILQMEKQGFDLCRERKIEVYPGMYPAVDPILNIAVLDSREFIARAWFRHRAPKLIRTELEPELLAPILAARG